MNRIQLMSAIKPGIATVLLMFLGMAMNVAQAATINKTVCVRGVQLFGVPFWGFNDCAAGPALVPGPVVEVGVGDTLNLTLSGQGWPQEPAPYSGHTIHMHGADVTTSEDGIPETGGVIIALLAAFIPLDALGVVAVMANMVTFLVVAALVVRCDGFRPAPLVTIFLCLVLLLSLPWFGWPVLLVWWLIGVGIYRARRRVSQRG